MGAGEGQRAQRTASGAVMDPRAIDRTAPGLEGARRAAEPAGHAATSSCSSARPARDTHAGTALVPAVLSQRRQLHYQPRQRLPLAGAAGRSAGRRDLPGLCRRRRAVRRRRQTVRRRRHRRYGRRQGRRADDGVPARHGAARRSTRCSPKAARGQLGKRQLISQFQARRKAGDPQSYAIGIKELWDIDPRASTSRAWSCTPPAGRWTTRHLWRLASSITATTTRWPWSASSSAWATSNPYLCPFEEFQRYKTHPAIRRASGRRHGASATAPAPSPPAACRRCRSTVFPGGALVGDNAGFLNVARIKGSHAAIKTGMLAAEAAFDALGRPSASTTSSPPIRRAFEKPAGCMTELQRSRNFKPWMKKGLLVGTLMAGIEQWLLPKLGMQRRPGRCTTRSPDHASLRPADQCEADRLSEAGRQAARFDRLQLGVPLQHAITRKTSPCHLTLKRSGGAGRRSTCAPMPARKAATARPASTKSSRERQGRGPAADQRAELRPLQDLRHQGPDPEHRLGHARRRRRSHLCIHVDRPVRRWRTHKEPMP